MNQLSEQLLTLLMFALMHTLLLSGFVPPADRHTTHKRSMLIAGSILVQTIVGSRSLTG